MRVANDAYIQTVRAGNPIAEVIAGYDDFIVRAYAWGRFRIMRQRFLEEIGQYLPARGRVLDIGCGFGLFSLYYAKALPSLNIRGFDLNPRRIEMATRAAKRLGLGNVQYEVRDAQHFRRGDQFDAAYMLDIIHHIPPAAAQPLIQAVADSLPLGGVLLLKDVDTHPTYKRVFTRVLDWAMDPRAPVRYWSAAEMQGMVEKVGFRVYRHKMIDILPYPHMLYICSKVS
jgi:2-polyprenyl-3-methyl-5-hydroxy-6-metoxy-1,4-benzoquinol methylase